VPASSRSKACTSIWSVKTHPMKSTPSPALDAHIAQKVDRPLADLSPIEHGVLWIGTYEMLHCMDVPWRAVINECIELAKEFGGTDGHKYVNAVLNGLAPSLRADEVRAHRATPAAP